MIQWTLSIAIRRIYSNDIKICELKLNCSMTINDDVKHAIMLYDVKDIYKSGAIKFNELAMKVFKARGLVNDGRCDKDE